MSRGQKHLLIIWHDSHLTGIKILDEQHRAYVSIINSLHYILSARQDDEANPQQPAGSRPTFLQPIYEMVIGHSKVHFKVETDLLKLSQYPHLYAHKAEHDLFFTRAEAIYHNCLKEGGDPELFLGFLKDFWQKHILGKDMEFSEHLIKYFQSHQRIIKKNK